MKWESERVRIAEFINTYTNLVAKPSMKRQLWWADISCRLKDNIQMNLNCCVSVQIGLHLVQNSEPGQVSLEMAINFNAP